jgi:hypothetical protein
VCAEQIDACIVGDHQAIKAPLLAQYFGQEEVRPMTGFVVDVVLGGHHRAGLGLLNRHFKWQHEGVV